MTTDERGLNYRKKIHVQPPRDDSIGRGRAPIFLPFAVEVAERECARHELPD